MRLAVPAIEWTERNAAWISCVSAGERASLSSEHGWSRQRSGLGRRRTSNRSGIGTFRRRRPGERADDSAFETHETTPPGRFGRQPYTGVQVGLATDRSVG